MIINRIWAMPNKWTFKIEPIMSLIKKYINNGDGWLDPFSGLNSPAQFTNDLNLDMPSKYHLEALEFLKLIQKKIIKDNIIINGCLFDPPYSLRQVKECYDKFGIKNWQNENKAGKSGGFTLCKNIISQIIKAGGITIHFGWNSNGFGKARGFEIIEILLIAHGRNHNDTIITVEQKVQDTLLKIKE